MADGCGHVEPGAARQCGGSPRWHLQTDTSDGQAVSVLCDHHARHWRGYGVFTELHNLTDACTSGRCNIHTVAQHAS